ncbi:hypothetical protein C4J81_12155 [Deltaproteobacteria bacterium Smac51]|nr:hypothetical protein C4J81_12155 [Deltaproteobacteria bacterium Smac51]
MSKLTERLNGLLDIFKTDDPIFSDDMVLYEGDSEHHHIVIREEYGQRTMYFGPCGEEAETSIDIANPDRGVFEYPGMMLAALPLHPEGKRIAMLGLGGGYMPRLFSRHLPDYHLTVVELDILVVELAQTYFGFTPGSNVELVVGDGRDFIERQPPESFDQIWLDAFSGDYVPPQLSGLDFLNLCKRRLTPGGLLVQNLHQNRPNQFQRQLKTTQAAFGSFMALDGRYCGNAIVVAKVPGGPAGPEWKTDELIKAAKKYGPRLGPYDLSSEMKKFKTFIPDPSAEVIL